ncbi:MAG: HU family DNA-binding protein [Coprobacillus cateniformis]
MSGFGKFEVTERSARTGINPATKKKSKFLQVNQ